jgi:hypothetical protein
MGRASVCPSCSRVFINERALKSHMFHRASKCKQFISNISEPEIASGSSYILDNLDQPELVTSYLQPTHEDNYSENSSIDK